MKRVLPNIVAGEPATSAFGAPFIAQYIRWRDVEVSPPDLTVDILDGARIFPGTVNRRDGPNHFGGQLLLSHDFQEVRSSRGLLDGSYSWPVDVDINASPVELKGNHFFLGSAHHHFGHFILEGLSRLWAWSDFAESHPDGKCIIYEAHCPPFVIDILGRIGIDHSRILFMQTPLLVERLHAPDPGMRTHHWVSSKMADTWQRIAQSVGPHETGRKIYLSRRHVGNRSLRNEMEVEHILRSAGFDIVVPESLPITEQIRFVRSASTLAGCVGSQMYLSAFMRPGCDVAVMAPANFYLRDDCLIGAALEHRIHLAFGETADFSTKERSWYIPPSRVESLLNAL